MSKKVKPKRFFGSDTIDYSLIWEPNKTYEQDLVEWDAMGSWEDDEPRKEYLIFKLILNGTEIGKYTTPYELLRVLKQSSCYSDNYEYGGVCPDNDHTHSNFYPWTCSCGHAGCNAIFDGVYLKVRGRSVEWRVNKDMGYEFLDKTFYQFDKQDYFSMIEKLKGDIYESK